MRFTTHTLSILILVALPLSLSLPNSITGIRHRLRNWSGLARQPQFDFKDFEITQLSILCSRHNVTVDYFCDLKFNWYDPNSDLVHENKVNSGQCRTDWSWDGKTKHNATIDGSDPVAPYRLCWADQATYFQVAVPSFWRPGNFSLELCHHYHDDKNFTKPWDYPTVFAFADPVLLSQQDVLLPEIYHYTPGLIQAQVLGLVD